MPSDLPMFFTILILAFAFEVLDSALGQGYGTLGSPVFILLGFDPKIVVPAILLSQALGGLSAAFFHNHFKNANFSQWKSEDLRKVYYIVTFGVVGVIISSILGVKLPKSFLSWYIGILVFIIGILILCGFSFSFSWKKFIAIGLISSFNKGLSGGGYGPLVAGGQVLIGIPGKNAIGITDFAEAPICFIGFLVWSYFSNYSTNWQLAIPMCIGAAIAPILGAWITHKLSMEHLKKVLGIVLLILGILCLAKLLNP